MEFYKILEERYAGFVGTRYAVAVNSGTAALHLALVALGIGEGDEVIVPDFTMAACGFAVSYTGARPVFVDCGSDLTIDVTQIEEKITEKTKAIMPVHIYGRLCDMEAIKAIADKHNLLIVEDAAEAHGAARGGYADALCFSFYKNKIIHAEEGGIICTDSKELYEKCQDLKSMAFGGRHDYFHERIGFNYRMPDTQAFMVLSSLDDYAQNAEKRRNVEAMFATHFYSKPHDAVWVYDSMSPEKDRYMQNAASYGIPARHFFKPLSSMPMWQGQEVGVNAARYSAFGFYLPVIPDFTRELVDKMVSDLTR